VVLLAGNTAWSTPERLRGEVLTTMRYNTNRRLPLPTFTYWLMYLRTFLIFRHCTKFMANFVVEPDSGSGQNAECNPDGTCADLNAQCIRGNCVCKLSFFYRNSVCGQSFHRCLNTSTSLTGNIVQFATFYCIMYFVPL